MKWLASCILATSLYATAGCTLAPSVEYVLLDGLYEQGVQPFDGEIATYSLAETWLQIGADEDNVCCDLGAVNLPHSQGVSIGMISRGTVLLHSEMSVVHEADGHIVDAIIVGDVSVDAARHTEFGSSDVEEQRHLTYLQHGRQGEQICTFNASAVLRTMGRRDTVEIETCPGVMMSASEVPAGAISIRLLSSLPPNNYFYFPSCRSVEITLGRDEERVSLWAVVSDPQFLQRVRIPTSGVVHVGDSCGAVAMQLPEEGLDQRGVVELLGLAKDTVFGLLRIILPWAST